MWLRVVDEVFNDLHTLVEVDKAISICIIPSEELVNLSISATWSSLVGKNSIGQAQHFIKIKKAISVSVKFMENGANLVEYG